MTNSELPFSTVKDITGNVYYLDKILGQGGQGMVCRTKDENFAVKLLMRNDEVIQDPDVYNKYQEIINDVVILRIDNDIKLCKPEIMLEKPVCGYVMKLLADLKSVSMLIYDPNSDSGFSEFFRDTQGLKKRVEVLIELARTLARLHSKGLVYCDISHNNVFFSGTEVYSNVWLIDCDNIRFLNERRAGLFTPGYGAPEVVNNVTGNTVFSDCFSFAVLAFRMLTHRSPFEMSGTGETSEGDAWDATTEDTDRGEQRLTWIFENGVSDENKDYFQHFLDKQLLDMFERTFGEKGRLLPTSRPSMQEWYEVLKTTLTRIRKCECDSFILASEKNCPFCKRGISYVHSLQIYKFYSKRAMSEVVDEVVERVQQDNLALDVNESTLKNNILELKYDYPTLIYDGMRLYNIGLFDVTVDTTPFQIMEFRYVHSNLTITNKYQEDIVVYYQQKGEVLHPGDTRSLSISGKESAAITIKDPVSGAMALVRVRGV